MKITNSQIIANINALNVFINKDIPLPYLARRAIMKNHKMLMEEYKMYRSVYEKLENELRLKVDTRFKGKSEDEMSKEEKQELAELREQTAKQIDELLAAEVEVEIYMIPDNLLENLDLSLKDEMAIEFMIEEV